MSHMPALDNPTRIDVTALEARVTALEAGGGNSLSISTVMIDRPLNVPFRPSLTHYVHVVYTCALAINDGADDAGLFLMSDATNDPQTVRCKATYFNAQIDPAALYTSSRKTISYIVPPGHYVKLQQSLVGTAAPSVEMGVEQTISIGTPVVTVTTDATSGKKCPSSSAEFTELGLDVADALWLMQDTSGNPVDEHGACKLTAAGTVSYANAESGWTRTFIGTTNGSAGTLTTSSSTLPNPASASMGVLMYAKVSTPTGTRSLLQFAANDLRARITTTPLLQLLVDGGSTQSGVSDPTGSVRPIYMQYDFTGQTAKIYTDQEIITATWSVAASRNVIFGDGAAAATARYGYAFAYYGEKAEMTDAEVRAMLQALGWTVSW